MMLALGSVMLVPTAFAASHTFRIGIGVALDSLDPAQQTTTTVMNVIDYDLQTLVTFNKEGKLEPQLATSWSTSDGGKVLTLNLRKGVTFQDGTPFNAKAVKFSLERLINGKVKVHIGAAYKPIESIDTPDPYTVKIHIKYPDPDLLPNLGATMAAIFSPASVKKHGNSYTNIVWPVGTGPYELVSRTKGSQIVFKRNDHYWGKKPYYNKVEFKIMPEANAREAGLLAGQLDMIMTPPVTDLESLAARGGISVLKAPDDRTVFMGINQKKKPFANKQVRQALNYAVNKKALIKNVLFDTVNPVNSPFADSLASHCKVGNYDYNPAKAKKLLSGAGVDPGKLDVTLASPTGRYLQDIQAAQAIAGDLRNIGLHVKVRTMDWPSYLSNVNSQADPFDMFLLGWAPIALDAPAQMDMFTKSNWPPNGLNGTFYSDPKVEALYSKAKRELDKGKRDKLYCEIQKKIWDDAPWIFLWSQTLILAYNNHIAGISYEPNEKFNTIYAHPK